MVTKSRKPKSPTPLDSVTPGNPGRCFRQHLEAADRIALDVLIRDGVFAPVADNDAGDRNAYFAALQSLADRFADPERPYQTTDLDDVIHLDHHEALVNAAHMVGLALGLRLRGADLGLTGGAR